LRKAKPRQRTESRFFDHLELDFNEMEILPAPAGSIPVPKVRCAGWTVIVRVAPASILEGASAWLDGDHGVFRAELPLKGKTSEIVTAAHGQEER
jgi:hypothetical protein